VRHGPDPPFDAIKHVFDLKGLQALRRREYTNWSPSGYPGAEEDAAQACITAVCKLLSGPGARLVRRRQRGSKEPHSSSCHLCVHMRVGWQQFTTMYAS